VDTLLHNQTIDYHTHMLLSVSTFSFYILSLEIFSNTNRRRFNTQGVPAFGLIMPLECATYITRHVSFQISSDCSNT